MISVRCGKGHALSEPTNLEPRLRQGCPVCGSRKRAITSDLDERLGAIEETPGPSRGRPRGSGTFPNEEAHYWEAVKELRRQYREPTDGNVAPVLGVDRTTVGRLRRRHGILRHGILPRAER